MLSTLLSAILQTVMKIKGVTDEKLKFQPSC